MSFFYNFTLIFVCLSELTLLNLTAVRSDISVPKQVYLQSIHLTRLVSRLITVKPQQSEWPITDLFSAECGASLNSSRVGSAELNVYPYIIPGWAVLKLQNGEDSVISNLLL